MHKALVVGVAGGTASGKTTLVASLAESLRAEGIKTQVFSLDAYFYTEIEKSPQVILPTGEVWFDRNHPDSADTARMVADVAGSLGGNDVVIVEGHLVLALTPLRQMMDVRVFVELEDDTRALRRMLRDMKGGRGNPDPEFIAEYYITCAKRGHDLYVEPSRVHADLILRGDAPLERTVRLLSSTIRGMAI